MLTQIHPLLALELVEDPIHQSIVPVVTAKVRVAVGGFDLEDTVADFQHRDVEGTSAQIINRDLLVLLFIQTVCQRCRGRFVDDAQDIEAGDAPGVLGSLALRVVKVGRYSDDGLGDLFAEAHFGIGLELAQDHCRDLRRAECLGLTVYFYLNMRVAVGCPDHLVRNALNFFLHLIKLAPHESFDRIDSVARIGDSLALCRIPDQAFTTFGEGDNRRCSALAF